MTSKPFNWHLFEMLGGFSLSAVYEYGISCGFFLDGIKSSERSGPERKGSFSFIASLKLSPKLANLRECLLEKFTIPRKSCRSFTLVYYGIFAATVALS